MTQTLKDALYNLRKDLLENGYEIETERWQGATEHPAFLEILHADMQAQMYDNAEEASTELKASQPWADLHFKERVVTFCDMLFSSWIIPYSDHC